MTTLPRKSAVTLLSLAVAVRKHLEKIANADRLSFPSFEALAALADSPFPISPSGLAQRCGYTAAFVSNWKAGWVIGKLISETPSERDRRSCLLVINVDGQRVVASIRARIRQFEGETLPVLMQASGVDWSGVLKEEGLPEA
jgi:hypothetical protein